MSEMHRCKLNMRPEAFCFKMMASTAYQAGSKVSHFLSTLPPSYPHQLLPQHWVGRACCLQARAGGPGPPSTEPQVY